MVFVEGVQLHATVVEAGVETTEGGEDGEAVVLVDQMTADVLHGDHDVLQVGHLHIGHAGHGT